MSYMIDFVPNFAAISFSIYKIIESIRKSSSILLQSIFLTIFMAENARSLVAVETRRVSTSVITL